MNPAAQTVTGQVEVDQTHVTEKTYYSSLDGNTYICKNGHICRFENGAYSTIIKGEQDELDAVCRLHGQYQIAFEPLDVRRSDAKVMKEVGSQSAGNSSGTGMVSTQHLGALLQR